MNTVGSTDEAIRPSFLHNVCSTVFLNEGVGGGGGGGGGGDILGGTGNNNN